VIALAELLGKRVRTFAGEAGGAVRVSGCIASAAGLHPFEFPSAAGGLPLVRAGLHLAVRHGAGELVCEGSFVPVGEGLDKNAMPARLIARDFDELRSGALFLFYTRVFALGGGALDLFNRVGVTGLVSHIDAIHRVGFRTRPPAPAAECLAAAFDPSCHTSSTADLAV
jgi:hypothetical protein